MNGLKRLKLLNVLTCLSLLLYVVALMAPGCRDSAKQSCPR